MTSSSRICDQLYTLARSHNARNVELELNGVSVLVLQRLEDADHVLRLNATNYRKNMDWFRQVLGASRFSEDGHSWEIRRELTQIYFNKFDRERTFELAATHARAALGAMIAQANAGRTTLDDDVLRAMTASVLVESFFDLTLSQTQIDLGLMARLMEYGSEYSFVPSGRTVTLYRERLAELPELRRLVLASMRAFRSEDVPATPILAAMRAADEDRASNIVLEHEMMSFLAAGAETSAATMGWACHLLARHPQVQDELRDIAADFWQSGQASWANLSRLRPLAQFISEALRLYPPTPIVARLALAPDRIGEREIEAGQNVLISFVGIQHDSRLRRDPWNLDITEGAARHGSGENTAFSFGPRVCGGKQFAMVELVTFLSVFLADARFEPTAETPLRFHWKSQMLREGGHPVRVVDRTDSAPVAAEKVS